MPQTITPALKISAPSINNSLGTQLQKSFENVNDMLDDYQDKKTEQQKLNKYDEADKKIKYEKYLQQQKAVNYLKIEQNYKKAEHALDANKDNMTLDEYKQQVMTLAEQRANALSEYASKDAAAKATFNIDKIVNNKINNKIYNDVQNKVLNEIQKIGGNWRSAKGIAIEYLKTLKNPEQKTTVLNALNDVAKLTDIDDLEEAEFNRNQKLITNSALQNQTRELEKQFNSEKLNILSSTFENGKFKNIYKDSAKYKQDEQKYVKSLINSGVSQSDALTYWNNITKIKEPKQLSITQQQLLDAKKDKTVVDSIDVNSAKHLGSVIENITKDNTKSTAVMKAYKMYNSKKYYNALQAGKKNINIATIYNILPKEVQDELKDDVKVTKDIDGKIFLVEAKNPTNIFTKLNNIYDEITNPNYSKQLYSTNVKLKSGKWTFSQDGKQAQWDDKFGDKSNLSDNAKYGLHMKILSKNKNNILPSLENLKKDNPGYYGYLSKNKKAIDKYVERRKLSLLTKGMKGAINTATGKNIKITSDYHGNVMFALPSDNNSFYKVMDTLPKGAALVTSNLGQETINTYRERLKTIKKDNKKLGKLKYILKKKFNISHATGNWKVNQEKFAEVIDYIAHDNEIDELIKQ